MHAKRIILVEKQLCLKHVKVVKRLKMVRLMQRILDPIVMGRIKKMTNNEVFMKTKDNYKGTNQWLVLSDPTEMKEKYFFS
jgi:hypothetical protein